MAEENDGCQVSTLNETKTPGLLRVAPVWQKGLQAKQHKFVL
jgi:hypothetical protein